MKKKKNIILCHRRIFFGCAEEYCFQIEILLEKESRLYCAAGEHFFRCKEYCEYMEILLEKEKAINCAAAGEIFFGCAVEIQKIHGNFCGKFC